MPIAASRAVWAAPKLHAPLIVATEEATVKAVLAALPLMSVS